MSKILITGASSGIGAGLYGHYKRKGLVVVGLSRRGPDVYADLTHNTRALIANIVREYGAFDVVILNAGMTPEDELAHHQETLQLNFLVNWHFLERQYKVGDLVRFGGCFVVNGSALGVTGCGDLPFYSATKAALLNLVKSYAKMLVQEDVRVNAFSCGFVDTPMNADVPKRLINAIPMKRQARVEELFPVVDMLIDCTYMTGANVIVDGGESL